MVVISKILSNIFIEAIDKVKAAFDFNVLLFMAVSFFLAFITDKIDGTSNKTQLVKLIISLSSTVTFLYANYLIFIGLPYEFREIIVAFITLIPILLVALSLYVLLLKI